MDECDATKAFYRVVAVDEKGDQSGPSDVAEFARPFVYGRPPTRLRVGRPIAYAIGVIASIGNLTCMRGYKGAFWDREYLSCALVGAPRWLKIDPASGQITGTPGPGAVGTHEVVVEIANSAGGKTRSKFALEVTE